MMGGNNAYLKKLQQKYGEGLNLGMEYGEQYALDMMMICLHRQGWGYNRVDRLMREIKVAADYYADALHQCMEQDIKQEKMDAELRDLVKDNQVFITFKERYPGIQTCGYDKQPKR